MHSQKRKDLMGGRCLMTKGQSMAKNLRKSDWSFVEAYVREEGPFSYPLQSNSN